MDVILLDTNIVSFILKGDSRASDYEPYLSGHRLAVSFMTVAELYQWAALHHSLPLVTHNPKDFVNISNLKIITTVV